MPGQKEAYRLYSSDGRALIDLLMKPEEEPPKVTWMSARCYLSNLVECMMHLR
jgi:hypothetical protein